MPKKSWLKSVRPSGVRGIAAQVGEVERADAEHLAGAFGIAGGDDRRVHPEEAVLVEVAMDRHAEAVAHAGDGAERVGARPQVRDLAQVLERRAASAGSDTPRGRPPSPTTSTASACSSTACPWPWLCDQDAAGDDRAAGGQLLDLALVVRQLRRGDDLDAGRSTSRRAGG